MKNNRKNHKRNCIPNYCGNNIFHFNPADNCPAISFNVYESDDKDYLYYVVFSKGIFSPPDWVIKIPAYEILRIEDIILSIVDSPPDIHCGWDCLFGVEEWSVDYEYNGISIHRGHDFFEPEWFSIYKNKLYEIFDFYRLEYGKEGI